MIAAIIIGILSIVVPGFFLALALLKRTGMHIVEIFLIGIFFGIIFPPAMVWLEAYLIPYAHIFSFSAGLYDADVIVLTIIGIALSYWQGAISTDSLRSVVGQGEKVTRASISADYRQRVSELRGRMARLNVDMKLIKEHEQEELDLMKSHAEEMDLLKSRSAGSEETESVRRQHESQERRLYEEHEQEEQQLIAGEEPKQNPHFPVVWTILLLLMAVTFASRIANIGFSQHFFEFDPYFDMMATQQILTYGYQLYTTHAAWPTLAAGTIQRIQPAVPYLEAYWYQLANPGHASLSLSSLSTVGGIYPPLLAALLVFVVFMFVYHIYGDFPGLIAAGIAAAMPTLISTYISGEQLLEPWGITALFFFFAAYLLAIKNPKEKRYAILAGIAFISNFLGAHYYTVSAGILAIYILFQAVINALRNSNDMDFYKMNAVMLFVIIIGYVLYAPYNAVYGGGVPTFLKIPTIIAFPLFALIAGLVYGILTDSLKWQGLPRGVAAIGKGALTWFDARPEVSLALSGVGLLLMVLGLILLPVFILPGLLIVSIFGLLALFMGFVFGGWGSFSRHRQIYSRFAIAVIISIILACAVLFTPIGNGIKKYLNLSTRFTTPSSPLFMTVQEYAPTGLGFDFGGPSFIGGIALSIGGVPVLLWLVLIAFSAIEAYNIALKRSSTSVLSIWILAVLAAAGMSEIKYLPHFAVAYAIAFVVVIAEMAMYIKRSGDISGLAVYSMSFLAAAAFIYGIIYTVEGSLPAAGSLLTVAVVIISAFSAYIAGRMRITPLHALYGLSSIIVIVMAFSLVQVFSAAAEFSGVGLNTTAYNQQCNNISTNGTNILGATMFCYQVPNSWLAAMSWASKNIGPNAPRILAWWDYGDWINWFGNTNAVIRGDNAVAQTDYNTAAKFVIQNTTALAMFMNQNTTQAQYVLFDDQLLPKWSALDFLGCVDQNQTSQSFAESEGKKYGANFVIGTSQCELSHDPVFVDIPEKPTIQYYCNFSNSTVTAVHVLMTTGETVPHLLNQSYCINTKPDANGVMQVYYANGIKANMLVPVYQMANALTSNGITTRVPVSLNSEFYLGATQFQQGGTPYLEFIGLYLPNGPNYTVTDAMTSFYNSNYYRGFFLGHLSSGFSLVYPVNYTSFKYLPPNSLSSNTVPQVYSQDSHFTGMNFINATNRVIIFRLNNYTASLPEHTPKPGWVTDNYTIPG
ncbi:MAG: hypothetical protein M1321_02060 [Candidatus Marsarchaeota archaeon]|nr:hypothetical protein [Candidatus Marsarchaeota archaeon]